MSTSTASQLATARSGSTSNALTLVPCSARQPTMRNTEGRSRAQFASANLDGSAGSSEAAASELHKAAFGRRDGRLAQGAPRRMQSSLATRMLDAAQRAGAIAPGPAAMTMCDALVASRVSGTSSNSAPAAAKSWEQQRCRETRRGPHVAGHRASVSVCDVCGMRRGARPAESGEAVSSSSIRISDSHTVQSHRPTRTTRHKRTVPSPCSPSARQHRR